MSAADSAATPTHTAARGPRRLSRRRRSLYAVITVVFAYVVIESFAWLLMYMAWGGMSAAQSRLVQAAAGGTEGTVDPKIEVVHPFLGYVMHVDNDNYNVQGVQPYSVTDFGLYDAASPLRKRSPDRVIVAITGGSVAHHFSVLAADELAAHLADVYPGRTIEFVRLGLPGYKQPQQLMILTYILALGGELDVVINLDGFNETVLPAGENVPHGVFAAFPRSWQYRVVTGNDLSLLRAVGRVAYSRARRQEISQQMAPYAWSPAAMLIWKARMNRADQQLHDALQDSVRIGATSAGFCASGPGQLFADEAGLMPHLADLWADSSLQMHRLCASNQIEYYHFLQPTRHFPTTDPTDEDRAEGYIPPTIQAGYPLLQQQGALLQDQGVAFTDLTEMFEPLQSGVYTDAAHLNKPANDRLAERIAHSIAEYRSRP